MIALLLVISASPEAQLTAAFERMASLRNATVQIAHGWRENALSMFTFERFSFLSLESPNRFRLESNGYWGDAKLFVSDGKTLLVDACDDAIPIVLMKAPENILTASQELEPKPFSGAMTWVMLAGAKGLDRIRDAAVPVTQKGDTVSFRSRGNGQVWVTLKDGLPTSIEFDNKAQLKAAYRFNPFWNNPVDDPMTREEITVQSSTKFRKDTFSTKVPMGRKADDGRTVS